MHPNKTLPLLNRPNGAFCTCKIVCLVFVFICTTPSYAASRTHEKAKTSKNRAKTFPFSQARSEGLDLDDFIDNIGNSSLLKNSRDTNFGSGKLTVTIGTGDDAGRAAVILADGSVVSVGRFIVSGTNDDFMVVRFTQEGALDTSFNTTGNTTFSFGTAGDTAHAISQQTDGKFMVVGKGDVLLSGSPQFAVARILTDGALDTSFNTTGKVSTNIQTNADIARAVVIQTDAKTLAGGYSKIIGGAFILALTRYSTDGILDTSFNTIGYLTHQIGTSDEAITAMSLDATGRVVATGNTYNGSNFDIALLRINTNGTLDTSFKNSGKLSVAIGTAEDSAYAIKIQTTGEIVVGGSVNNGSNLDFAVLRYLTNGTLDTTFNTNGKLSTTIGTSDDGLFGLVILTDGKLLTGGYSASASDDDFAMIRYNTNGTLDTAWNSTGKVTTIFNTSHDRIQGLTTLTDDFIIVVGRTFNGTNFDIAIGRYSADGSLAPSGGVDPGFGN